MGRWRYINIALAVVGMIVPRLVGAQEALGRASKSSASATVVMIVPVEQDEESLPIVRAIKSQFSDLEIELQLVSVEALGASLRSQVQIAESEGVANDALAVFWCDIGTEEHAFLYLAEAGGDRLLVRRLSDMEEGALAEELAIIVRTSVAELMRGGRIGVAVSTIAELNEPPPPPVVPPPPPEPPPVEEPEPPVPDNRTLSFRLSYAMYIHSSDHPAVHGLDLGMGVRFHPNWSVTSGYTILSTISSRAELAAVRLNRHPINLGIRTNLDRGAFHFTGSAKMLFDYTTFEDHSLADGMISTTDTGNFLLSVLPAVEFAWYVNAMLGFFLAAGAEISIISRQYVVQGDDGRQTILDSWPVQPWFFAGIVLEML